MTQNEIAEYALDIFKDLAAGDTTITYGELGRRIGIHHRPIPGALGVI